MMRGLSARVSGSGRFHPASQAKMEASWSSLFDWDQPRDNSLHRTASYTIIGGPL